jgi:D-glycero-D-manno-heptose 1,7-bisphosphate phosphatase
MTEFRGLIVLDRDGVLNRTVFHSDAEPRDSPLSPADVVLEDGVPEALKALEDAGYVLAVASNQPSAAKGKTTHEALVATHDAVLSAARSAGARLADSFICFHRAEDDCRCRKPKPGLLEDALAATPGSKPETSWMVGDRVTDVFAGAVLGFRTAFIGPGWPGDEELLEKRGVRPSFRGRDLQDFTRFLLEKGPS